MNGNPVFSKFGMDTLLIMVSSLSRLLNPFLFNLLTPILYNFSLEFILNFAMIFLISFVFIFLFFLFSMPEPLLFFFFQYFQIINNFYAPILRYPVFIRFRVFNLRVVCFFFCYWIICIFGWFIR